jgi:hypothetical protein
MKLEIELDLTPEEARTLLGLPDLQPIHDIYLNRMKNFVEKGITPEMMGDMVKSWSSFGGAGMGLIQQLLGGVAGGLGGGRSKTADTDSSDSAPPSGSRKR